MEYRIDIFAVFIFLGIVQGVFLSFFYLSPSRRKNPANLFEGLLILSMVAIILEIFLMYTGYIRQALHWVDFSESIALLLGPLYYLIVRTHLEGKPPKRYWLHFLPFAFYSIYMIHFWAYGADAKWNAYVDAYRPDLEFRAYDFPWPYDPLWLRKEITILILVFLTVYFIISLSILYKAFRNLNEPFFNTTSKALKRLRNNIFILLVAVVVVLFVQILFHKDTGDHFTAAFISLVIYIISFQVISSSSVFHPAQQKSAPKYAKSSLNADAQKDLVEKLLKYMEVNNDYLDGGFSLAYLARQLHVSAHHLSQTLNDTLGKNFFEFVAEYRIKKAKELLADQANSHLKIEEIAEQVGYNSKSSFNNSFKKFTNQTPSNYRSEQLNRTSR